MTPIDLQIIDLLRNDLPSGKTDAELRRIVFFRHNNIRLSHKGCNLLCKVVDYKTFTSDVELTGKLIRNLSSSFVYPYYLKDKTIIVFHKEDIFHLSLSGSLDIYLS